MEVRIGAKGRLVFSACFMLTRLLLDNNVSLAERVASMG